jgi:hypothetical protein
MGTQEYFRDVLDHLSRINGTIDSMRDTIGTAIQANLSMVTIADGEVTQEREGRKPRSFSLKRAPQLKLLLDSFVALLGGDASRLGEAFDVSLGRDAGRWMLTLTPRDARLAKQIASLQVYGSGDTPRCLRMNEPDGDVSIDLLGDLAAHMPAEPTREGLIAQCGGAM